MKKQLLALFSAIVLATSSFAGHTGHRNCGTMENLERMKKEDPGLEARMQQLEQQTAAYIAANKHGGQNSTDMVITIPVVFHIVYNTTAQNISDAQCAAQLAQLNADYARLNSDAGNTPSVWQGISANTNIQFCLAQRTPSGAATTGIERRQTTSASFSTNDNIKRYANGGLDAWSASSYLNIWVGNLSGGVLGYAQFPGGSASTDGVVLTYYCVGSMASPGPSSGSPYNLGRTATHEVGHWLNLYHIWGDDGTACSGSDNVSDTPNQAGENYGAPAFPRTDGCTSTSPGVMFMNYMDYTDDNAMNMFTNGQSTRMAALFGTGGSRVGLLSSLGCQAGSTTCNVPTGMSTSGITSSGATLNWTAVSGATSYAIRYRIVGAATWTSTTSTTNTKSLTGLVTSSNYEWQVSTVCSSGSSAYTGSTTFSTTATATCGTPTGMATASITSSGATLSWAAVSGATSYNVQYRLVGAASWTATTSTATSKAIAGLAASSAYEWQVQAVCSGGTGSFTASTTFTTAASTGCSDVYESNNTSGTAKTIATNTNITAMIGTSTDADWFKFTTTSPNTYIKITLTTLPLDYDIRLYNSSVSQLAISQQGGTTSEQIIRNTTSAATYYIKVYGYGGVYSASSCYTLRVSVGSTAYRTVEDIISEPLAEPGINDFTLYPNPAKDEVNIAFSASQDEFIQIRVFDMVGKTIRDEKINVASGMNKFSIDLALLNKGIYFVELTNSTERLVKKLILEK
ncbi:MAG TPA: M43 family zinc metalloprotease [Bacteroidia bacterium]|nr:M43 family zinc metalloprotease [Bacteroidia bacterium]